MFLLLKYLLTFFGKNNVDKVTFIVFIYVSGYMLVLQFQQLLEPTAETDDESYFTGSVNSLVRQS